MAVNAILVLFEMEHEGADTVLQFISTGFASLLIQLFLPAMTNSLINYQTHKLHYYILPLVVSNTNNDMSFPLVAGNTNYHILPLVVRNTNYYIYILPSMVSNSCWWSKIIVFPGFFTIIVSGRGRSYGCVEVVQPCMRTFQPITHVLQENISIIVC